MQRFSALCLYALSIPLIAQTDPQTFTSPDGAFQFNHSPALVHCTRGPVGPGATIGWIRGSCRSQGDLCDDDPTTGSTIACFAYPKDRFKAKPQFIAAVFFVGLVPRAATQKSCLESTQDGLVNDSRATKINGITAGLFHGSDAWMSGGESGEIYRVFHGNKCYEPGIQEVEASTGGLDPGTFQEHTAPGRSRSPRRPETSPRLRHISEIIPTAQNELPTNRVALPSPCSS
jgi:hypothetical protein